MKELVLPAKPEELDTVLDFINGELEEFGCSPKIMMQIAVSVEEIFVNIANYAYAPGTGSASIGCEISGEPLSITIEFRDGGTPYDPLKRKDPDITLSAEEREIGGLGIYMVKNFMDEMSYRYKDGQNILTLKKKL